MINRTRTIHIALAVAIFTLMSSAVAQSVITISSSDPRPLDQILKQLSTANGWCITYDDPQYLYTADISDVTLQVRRDLDQFPPGQAPKVLVPRAFPVSLSYDSSADPSTTLQQALNAAAIAEPAQTFHLKRVGRFFEVTPFQARDLNGQLVVQNSPLELNVAFTAQSGTVMDFITATLNAITQKSGVSIEVGTIPNILTNTPYQQTSANDRARTLITRALSVVNRAISWNLLFDPIDGSYALNLYVVKDTLVVPGDADNDGAVSCADVAIIKAALNKTTGSPGYDPRADVIADGIIDVRDLAFVSQHLPAGTRCQ